MSISSADLEWIRSLVQLRTGVVLDSDQGYLVEHRLSALVDELNLPSIDHLFYLIRHRADLAIRQQVIEALMTNETFFFRDRSLFEMLRVRIFPEIISQKADQRRLSVWSAACSSGQELFSVALLLNEEFPSIRNWNLELLGTDLSSRMIRRASRGEFSSRELSRGLSPEQVQRYFRLQPEGTFRIVESILNQLEFREQNLIAPWPPSQPYDLVLLRNVLIYFDAPSREALLKRLHKAMSPTGYLVLGGPETLLNLHCPFERVEFPENVCYRPRGD